MPAYFGRDDSAPTATDLAQNSARDAQKSADANRTDLKLLAARVRRIEQHLDLTPLDSLSKALLGLIDAVDDAVDNHDKWSDWVSLFAVLEAARAFVHEYRNQRSVS